MSNTKTVKRLLLLQDYGGRRGGAELLALDMRRLLRTSQIDVRVLASNADPWREEDAPDYVCFGTNGKLRALSETWNVSASQTLNRALQEFQPDIVHVGMFLTQLSPAILPALRNVPTVYGAQTFRLICPTGLRWLPEEGTCNRTAGFGCCRTSCLSPIGVTPRAVQLALIRQFRTVIDRLVVPSQLMANLFAAQGWPGALVVPNAVPLSPRRQPHSETPIIAFVGRLVPEKGVNWLLRSFATAFSDSGRATLEIIGDGPERPALEGLAVKLGISSQTKFLGHLDRDISEMQLQKAWIQVVPSLWPEPFGLVAAEALARGTTLVVGNSGGLAEIVDSGRTGLVVQQGDTMALANALVELVRDRPKALQFGEAGRQVAKQKYSQERWISQLLQVYNSLLCQVNEST